MISRYSRPAMARIWSEEGKLERVMLDFLRGGLDPVELQLEEVAPGRAVR